MRSLKKRENRESEGKWSFEIIVVGHFHFLLTQLLSLSHLFVKKICWSFYEEPWDFFLEINMTRQKIYLAGLLVSNTSMLCLELRNENIFSIEVNRHRSSSHQWIERISYEKKNTFVGISMSFQEAKIRTTLILQSHQHIWNNNERLCNRIFYFILFYIFSIWK